MIRTAVLPFGRAGIISASMLGLGRALGETIAVALVLNSGYTINWHLTEPGGDTFASHHRAEVRRGRRLAGGDRRADRRRPVPVRDHPGGQHRGPDHHRPQEGVHGMSHHADASSTIDGSGAARRQPKDAQVSSLVGATAAEVGAVRRRRGGHRGRARPAVAASTGPGGAPRSGRRRCCSSPASRPGRSRSRDVAGPRTGSRPP